MKKERGHEAFYDARHLGTPITCSYTHLYFALLGFLTVTLHRSLLQMAVLHMDASATSVIYSGNPVFALAAAHLILHEPLRKNHLLAIGVEVIGIPVSYTHLDVYKRQDAVFAAA